MRSLSSAMYSEPAHSPTPPYPPIPAPRPCRKKEQGELCGQILMYVRVRVSSGSGDGLCEINVS